MTALLAIDTADRSAGVAVLVDGELRAVCLSAVPFRHAERLFGLIDAALAAADLEREALRGIAVTRGPGSFTGLRVGLATAKGIACALGLPAVGVSTLRALAEGAMPFPGLVVPLLDARKRQVYAGAFDGRSGAVVVAEGAYGPSALAAELAAARGGEAPPLLLLGSGVGACGPELHERLGGRCLEAPAQRWCVSPAQVAQLGWEGLQRGEGADPALLVPVYHRVSEAEEARTRKTRTPR